ncbi:MAG: hypothetical protein AB7G11_02330 [Phycisphaerales bacterium]
MSKYRKKPVVVEAEQWFPGKDVFGVVTEPDAGMPYDIKECLEYGVNDQIPKCGAVKTLNGWALVVPGEWIIVGTAGERYPCKEEIFSEIYEPAEGDS